MDTNLDPEKLNSPELKPISAGFEMPRETYPGSDEVNPLERTDKSADLKLESLVRPGGAVENEVQVVVEDVKEDAGNMDALKGLEYTTGNEISKNNLVTNAIHENEDLTKPGKAYETLEALIGGDTVEQIT